MNRSVNYDPLLNEILAKAGASYRLREDEKTVQLLADAALRAPQRLDIKKSLANFHIQLGRPDLALDIFNEINRFAPEDVENHIYLAHWSRYCGDVEGAEKLRRKLEATRFPLAADLGRIWRHIDAWAGMHISDVLPPAPPRETPAAIITLGYILNADGTMREGLIRRLEKTLEAAGHYPDAVIVVTGGVPRNGTVEALEMRRWLEDRGIARDRIYVEGYARDLVENLVYSRQILDILNVDRALIVTSPNNVRRSGAAMEILCWANGASWGISVVASTLEGFIDDGGDRIKLYRDTLRAYGLLMMTVFPELLER